jgi:dihydrofolate synthase / folylpolyglutamate synthase
MLETVTVSPVYQAAIDFLFGRIDYERAASVPYNHRDLRLERMRELLARLDNPHQTFPIVHIAGTKGKGSTAAMISSILSAAGYRTGLYSSPHLHRVEERVAIDGAPCLPDELAELVELVRPAVEAMDRASGDSPDGRPTYFEITTAMALLHFACSKVDAAAIEVGLGGRLDSTNVCRPAVSVITSISYDHMKQLGGTLSAIAREKAGIIKDAVPVVSGVTDAQPRRVIDDVRRRLGCTIAELGADFEFTYKPPHDLDDHAEIGHMDFVSQVPGRQESFRNLKLALLGRHQAANAAVAIATVLELRAQDWSIPEFAIRDGLSSVRWPARVEVIGRRPTVVIDTAHNQASIESLLTTLNESFRARNRWLIFATTLEKQVREMLRLLLPTFDGVVLTRYLNNPRCVPLDVLRSIAAEVAADRGDGDGRHPPKHVVIRETPADAWRQVQSMVQPDDLICITGSFFLAAEMRAVIETA